MIAALGFATFLAVELVPPRAVRPRDAIGFSVRPDTTPDGYDASFGSAVAGFVVDPSKLHVDVAALDGAIRAKDVPHTVGAMQTRLGPPGPAQIVGFHVSVSRTLLRPGMQNLVFRLDPGAATRNNAPVEVETNPIGTTLHVYLSDRAHDAALQKRFNGATVATYGAVRLRCGLKAIPFADLRPRVHSALRILSLRRSTGNAAVLKAGGPAFDGSDWAFAYKAVDPLVVTFDPAVKPQMGGLAYSIPGSAPGARASRAPEVPPPTIPPGLMTAAPRFTPSPPPYQPHAVNNGVITEVRTTGCRSLDAPYADAWDLERAFELGAPASTPRDVQLGMTHEQVAELLGFPALFATKDELFRMPEWRYEFPAPFLTVVTFAGDRVVKYQPPGRLP